MKSRAMCSLPTPPQPPHPQLVRMTGCSNGCTRPYVAELAFVGDGPNSYQIWLGGSPSLTRLAEVRSYLV